MNYRDTSNETSTLWSVDAIEDMAFIQAANKEAFAHAFISQIGDIYDPAKVYVMWGCINYSSPPTYNLSWGALFHNGEIYTLDFVNFTVTTGVAVANLIDTSDGNMRLFSDNTTKPVTRIRKAVIAEGASGSGSLTGNANSDFNNFIFLPIRKKRLTYYNDFGGGVYSGIKLVGSLTTPADGVTRNWKIMGRIAIGGTSNSSGQFDVHTSIKNGSTFLDLVEHQTWGVAIKNQNAAVVVYTEQNLGPGVQIDFYADPTVENGNSVYLWKCFLTMEEI